MQCLTHEKMSSAYRPQIQNKVDKSPSQKKIQTADEIGKPHYAFAWMYEKE